MKKEKPTEIESSLVDKNKVRCEGCGRSNFVREIDRRLGKVVCWRCKKDIKLRLYK